MTRNFLRMFMIAISLLVMNQVAFAGKPNIPGLIPDTTDVIRSYLDPVSVANCGRINHDWRD